MTLTCRGGSIIIELLIEHHRNSKSRTEDMDKHVQMIVAGSSGIRQVSDRGRCRQDPRGTQLGLGLIRNGLPRERDVIFVGLKLRHYKIDRMAGRVQLEHVRLCTDG